MLLTATHSYVYNEDKTINFVGLSSLLHVALFMVAAVIAIDVKPKPMIEVTEIEFLAAPMPMKMGAQTVKEAKTRALKLEPATSPEDVIVKRSQAKKVSPVTKVAKPVAKPRAASKAARAYKTPTIAEADIPLPVLETPDLNIAQDLAPAELKDEDLSDEFKKIDREQNKKLLALQSEMDNESQAALRSHQEQINALKAETLSESKKMAALTAQRRAQEKAAIAAAAAAEAARGQAAKGTGRGFKDVAEGTDEGTGLTKGIRSLSELKQMPGNKRPEYDQDDRFHRRQGEISFLAYISKEGHPIKFKLIKGTGHRSLDARTLKAIQGWKFFPGQEGWVEIPFRWDLKGGPKEMPATLRRSISQFNN